MYSPALCPSLCAHSNVPAFGFLPGKEVKEAGVGNLGLHDREYRFYQEEAHLTKFWRYDHREARLAMGSKVHRGLWRRSGQGHNVSALSDLVSTKFLNAYFVCTVGVKVLVPLQSRYK